MDVNQVKALLEKYRDGNCSLAEIRLIEDWLATLNIGSEGIANDIVDTQLNTTKNKIDDIIRTSLPIKRYKHTNWLAVAATVFLFATVALAAGVIYFKQKNTNRVAGILTLNRYTFHGMIYTETPKGLTWHLKLADGSVITMNASSKLHYPVKFVNHKRPVYLDEGEALFEVSKDKTRPFTVYTKQFATTALGTAFNIRSYANEHKVSISLIHGKIKIEGPNTVIAKTPRILLPHQQITFNKSSGMFLQADFTDEALVTAWKDGALVFQNASTDQVINAIQNKFRVTIINNSNHNNWSYTGSFKDESLTDVLKTVCLTEGIAYSEIKDQITLY